MATLQEVVRKKHIQRQQDVIETITGGVASFDEYRFYVGYLKGMWDFAQDIAPLIRDPESVLDAEEGR